MDGCVTTGFSIPNDKDGKLKKLVENIGGHDIKRQMILASYLSNDLLLNEWKKYHIIPEDCKSYSDINTNTLKSLLNKHYYALHRNVSDTTQLREDEELDTFTSAKAKSRALIHTAELVQEEYYKNLAAIKDGKMNLVSVIRNVAKKITGRYFSIVVPSLIEEQKVLKNEEALKDIEEYNNITNRYNELRIKFNKNNAIYKDKNTSKEEREKLKEENKRIFEEIESIRATRTAAAVNLVNKYGNVRQKNYSALFTKVASYQSIQELNDNEESAKDWFNQVFNINKLIDISHEFESVLESNKLDKLNYKDDSDAFVDIDETIDQTAESWNKNLPNDFEDGISDDIKLYLNSIYRLDAEVTGNETNDNEYTYFTNNELGVPETIGYKELFMQIKANCSFASLDEFIEHLSLLGKLPAYYALGKIANDLKRDRVFASKMFFEFANPIVKKCIITVRGEDISFKQSNTAINASTALFYNMINTIKFTYKDANIKDDYERLRNLLNEIKNKGNYRQDSYFVNQDNIENQKRFDIAIYDALKKLFPNIDKDALHSFVYSNKELGVTKSYEVLIQNVLDLLQNVNIIKNSYNNEIANYKDNIKEYYRKLNEQAQLDVWNSVYDIMSEEEVVRENIQKPKINYDNINFTAVNNSIQKLVEALSFYTKASPEYNSRNAEGNLSSDIINNSYIMNLFNQIQYGNEQDSNRGLQLLGEYVTKSSQYRFSPIFFGITDNNGNVRKGYEGLFTITANGFKINLNAKKLLDVFLFNGAKDSINDVASMYDTMSKGDYFTAQLIAFANPIRGGLNASINDNLSSTHASYFMRTPSDAPKNFVVTAPKYSIKGLITARDGKPIINNIHPLHNALRQQLLGELNMFIEQLNHVLEGVTKNENGDNVRYTKNDVSALIERAHFNSDSIVTTDSNGRLVLSGNFFTFAKLFECEGINVREEIINALSLYGGDNAILQEENSRLVVNLTNLINNKYIGIDTKDNAGNLILKVNNDLYKIVDNITSKWIFAFIDEVKNNIGRYNIISSKMYNKSEAEINEFMLNTALAYMNFDDLFEGDVKYYKNVKDFFKRTKEGQAGGKAYSSYSLNDDIGGPIKYLKTKDENAENDIPILINDVEYNTRQWVNGLVQDGILKARNGFRAITIKNVVRPSNSAQQIEKEIYDYHVNVLHDDEITAKAIAESIANGYSKATAVDDAQSYIIFEEFIQRKFADGTLNQYMDVIQEILDVRSGKKKLKDIDISKIMSRIQVQKNFYYDIAFDKNTKCYYPRQIKNAEFVLIPELIKGTQLEELYNFMNKYDIGQVNTAETSKAAKRNVLTFWNNDGSINSNFENDLSARNFDAVEDYYYRFLYKQQDVSQHMQDKENKLAIQLLKKIIDNASDSVEKDVKDLFTTYCANIKEDFTKLVTAMGWAQNTDGSIRNINDDSKLNFDEFWKKARREAQRLGLDSNFIEYLTPEEVGGDPRMPNFMNNVSTKLESIAQSIFARNIVRQTLPGWHAAQVTSVGHGVPIKDNKGNWRSLKYHPTVYKNAEGKTITEKEYKELSKEEQNKYTVTQESYTEIMVPRWSKLIPEGYDISKLEKEGLDLQVAYRIPTEGKQSVSNVKIVGILNDIYGSTVMVPDEWVFQTGSDFDVDSVYAIYYKMYKDRKGQLKKIKFIDNPTDKENRLLYNAYVKAHAKDKPNVSVINKTKKRNAAIEAYNTVYNNVFDPNSIKENNEQFQTLIAQSAEAFKELPLDLRKEIYKINSQNKDKSQIIDRYDAIINYIESTYGEEIPENIKKYYDAQQGLLAILSLTKENGEEFAKQYEQQKHDNIANLYTAAKEKYNKDIDTIAENNGLLTYEEFIQLPVVERNSRAARDNKILDSIINIMNNVNSREENYSRSNSDDIQAAKEYLEEISGITARRESVYNPMTQLDLMESSISAIELKGISVSRDTFTSINNRCKSLLDFEDAINVIYNAKDYNITHAIDAYGLYHSVSKTGYVLAFDKEGKVINSKGEDYVKKNAVSFKVNHRMFGNSKTNRNVVGKLITPYSSQTTAHILDVVKIGALVNQNNYTFGTFKTLIDLGIDYHTATAFLMQPGVSSIVEAYNETRSIFVNTYGSPINTAIKRIAKKLGIKVNGKEINDYTPISVIKNVLSTDLEINKLFMEVFGGNPFTYKNKKLVFKSLPLNRKLLENRLKNLNVLTGEVLTSEDNIVNDIFDLGMIINFSVFNETTSKLESLSRLCTMDKNAAKQTIKETRDILDKINDIVTKDKHPLRYVLTSNAKGFVDALYPNFASGNIDIENSTYPYLAAFAQYAAKTSVEINSQLFDTESEEFVKFIKAAEEIIGRKFNKKTYIEFKQFFVTYLYKNIPSLINPLTVEKGRIVVDEKRKDSYSASERNKFWKEEIIRILGYEGNANYYFPYPDTQRLSTEESKKQIDAAIEQFNKLTPAQKVLWIQNNFNENAGVFSFLNVSSNSRTGQQVIKYNDQAVDVETLLYAFKEAFYNKDSFVKLAAIDLIKYAYFAEGFKFKSGNISKIVPNDCSIQLGIVDILKRDFTDTILNNESCANYIETFVRSHSEVISELKINDQIKQRWSYLSSTGSKQQGIIYIEDSVDNQNIYTFLGVGRDSHGALTSKGFYKVSRNVMMQHENGTKEKKKLTTLYKVYVAYNGIYLYPLNLLDSNETYETSYNNDNNKYCIPSYYRTCIESMIKSSVDYSELFKNYKEYKPIHTKYNSKNAGNNRFSLKYELEKENVFNNTLRATKNIIGKINQDTITVILPIQNAFKSIIENNQGLQYITVNGVDILFNIEKISGKDRKAINESIKNKSVTEENEVLIKTFENGIKPNDYEFYRFTKVTSEEQANVEEETESNDEMYATTTSAGNISTNSSYVTSQPGLSDIEYIAAKLYSKVSERARLGDKKATDIVTWLRKNGYRPDSEVSITTNLENIYNFSASLYENLADWYLNEINNFTTELGEHFNINSKEFYEYLKTHPDDFNKVICLILDCSKFITMLDGLNKLDVTAYGDDIKNYIERLKNAINKIATNASLLNTKQNIVNQYLVSNFSTNPLLKNGIIDATTQFGDVGLLDRWFSNIAEVRNKELQIISKQILSSLENIKINKIPAAVKAFKDNLDSILNDSSTGSFSWSNIINNDGTKVTEHNKEWIKDKKELDDEVEITKIKYGENDIRYIKAKLKRDKWYAKNVNKQIVPQYYISETAAREKVINEAEDLYLNYVRLINARHAKNPTSNSNSEEEQKRQAYISRQIKELLSPVIITINSDDTVSITKKSDEELNKIKALEEYIKTKRELDSQYIDTTDIAEFTEKMKEALSYVKDKLSHCIDGIERDRVKKYLIETDETFKNYIEFIESNSIQTFTAEGYKKLEELFEGGDKEGKESNVLSKAIANARGAIDRQGDIDGSKLTDEDLALLKEQEEKEKSRPDDENISKTVRLKKNKNNTEIYTKEYYDLFKIFEGEEDPAKEYLIAKANKILDGCFINGKLSIDKLIQKPIEDLVTLVSIYGKLNSFTYEFRDNPEFERFFNLTEKKLNTKDFKNHYNTLESLYNNGVIDERLFTLIRDIIGVTSEKDGRITANPSMYGYRAPKAAYKSRFLDARKTRIKQAFENDLMFVPNKYYYKAYNEALLNSTFDEWFEKNHILDEVTGEYTPLRFWMNMTPKIGGKFDKDTMYRYIPTNENTERNVKPDKINKNYNPDVITFNNATAENKYRNNVYLTEKERKVLQLINSTLQAYANSKKDKKFVNDGFMPRMPKQVTDARWYMKQALGAVGLEFRFPKENDWEDSVGYEYDRELSNNMLSILKNHNSKALPERPKQTIFESSEDYGKRLEEWKEEVAAIEEENKKIDSMLINNNWEKIMTQFIAKGVELQEREKLKNLLYFTLDNLKNNKAYRLSTWNNEPYGKKITSSHTDYATTGQANAIHLLETWIHRIIFDQFKENHKLNSVASLMQNMTSAKYMVFNLTGGVTNVLTGFTNILGESFAREYFNNKELSEGCRDYTSSIMSVLKDAYNDKTDNLNVALMKLFDVVNLDEMIERRSGETTVEYVNRVRNVLYIMQSGGEHFMQNSTMLAMLRSHKVYKDENGNYKIGTINSYINQKRLKVLENIIKDNPVYKVAYKEFINNIKNDKKLLKKYDEFNANIDRDFLNSINDKKLKEKYNKAISNIKEEATREFATFETLRDQFILKDGVATVKPGSVINEDILGMFAAKVKSVNEKIHGNYSKRGAASIETKWWGGLVMQYHKHIYPGFMKRFRRRGYYNELRETKEIGSYITLGQFLSIEFKNIIYKNENGKVIEYDTNNNVDYGKTAENVAKSVQNVIKALLSTAINLKANYSVLEDYEKDNLRRVLGDLSGIMGALMLTMAIYAATDDDDLKDSTALSTMLYISDRWFSESNMYTPYGAISEAKTLYSSPIAAKNFPEDVFTLAELSVNYMFDKDFNPEYTTGLYKGQNKFAVRIYRNIPAYRVIKRIENMPKNNKYYRIGELQMSNTKIAKDIADTLFPD